MPSKLIRVPHQLDQQVKTLARRLKLSEAEVYRRGAEQLVHENQPAQSILDPDWKPVPCKVKPSLDPDDDLYKKPFAPVRSKRGGK